MFLILLINIYIIVPTNDIIPYRVQTNQLANNMITELTILVSGMIYNTTDSSTVTVTNISLTRSSNITNPITLQSFSQFERSYTSVESVSNTTTFSGGSITTNYSRYSNHSNTTQLPQNNSTNILVITFLLSTTTSGLLRETQKLVVRIKNHGKQSKPLTAVGKYIKLKTVENILGEITNALPVNKNRSHPTKSKRNTGIDSSAWLTTFLQTYTANIIASYNIANPSDARMSNWLGEVIVGSTDHLTNHIAKNMLRSTIRALLGASIEQVGANFARYDIETKNAATTNKIMGIIKSDLTQALRSIENADSNLDDEMDTQTGGLIAGVVMTLVTVAVVVFLFVFLVKKTKREERKKKKRREQESEISAIQKSQSKKSSYGDKKPKSRKESKISKFFTRKSNAQVKASSIRTEVTESSSTRILPPAPKKLKSTMSTVDTNAASGPEKSEIQALDESIAASIHDEPDVEILLPEDNTQIED